MIRLLTLLLIWPTLLPAQPVTVQSGEHADFSRLVLLYDEVPEWTFGRIRGGYEMRPVGQTKGYDLSEVYEFIPRRRIASVTARPDGALFLEVDCECHADAFEVRAGLVLDIKDGKPTPRARFETLLPEAVATAGNAVPAAPNLDTGTPPISASPTEPGVVPVDALDSLTDPGELPLQFTPPSPDPIWSTILEPALTPAVRADPGLASRQADALEELLQQMGRAASLGLIDPDLTTTEALIEPPDIAVRNNPHPPLPATPAAAPESPEAAPNFRFETAIERSELHSGPPVGLAEDGSECLPDDRFDITNWGQPPDLGSAISTFRASLVGEFDTANPESIARLAKHYVFLTFGAEAAALLRAFEADLAIPDAEILLVMAEIMDHGFSQRVQVLGGQMNCPTRAALWAVLAKPSLARSDRIARDPVLAGFAGLPVHLRRHLGPILADRFLQIGDTDTATNIRNAIARVPGDPDDGLRMTEAAIALENGDRESGADKLTAIIKTDGPLAPEAVVRLIDSEIDAGRVISPDLIQTAAALAFESRGTPRGAELERVRLRALARAGTVSEVLRDADLARETFGMSPETVQSLRRQAFARAVTDADDLTFLQASLDAPLNIGPDAGELRREIAHRLITLGMTQAARETLSEGRPIPEPADRKLFARSFLLDQKANLAIGYLAGLIDAEAMELRARALDMAQDYKRAVAAYAELGQPDAQARAAWRGQDWSTVQATGTAAERAAAVAISKPLPTETFETNQPPTLALTETLLTRSRASRDVLAALLKDIPKP